MGKSKFDLEDGEGRNWKALVIPVILILLFVLALVIRSVFYWPPAYAKVHEYGDEGYLLSGNDPNYHKRTVDYAQETHTHLVFDPMLDYPKGGPNPNPPLYAWSTAFMGYAVAPFTGGDLHEATWVVMEFAAAFWAALTIFPVYIFTRDMFGKKPALFAAFFIATMAGNVERTPVGFSDHDAFVMFFVVLSFLFLMRAMRMLNNRNYVKDWFNSYHIATGVRDMLRENKKAFLYGTMAGLSIGCVALAWKGVAYLFAIILVYYVFHLSIKKLRKEEGLGIAIVILWATGLSLLVSFPYYYLPYFTVWFESPFFVFVAMSIVSLFLVPTRDLPWLLVVPMIIIFVFGGMFVLAWVFPSIMNTIFSLQGYFVRTKLYETIAEAQSPDFSRLVFSYGVITFYLTVMGAAWAAYKLPKERWRNDYIVTVIWAIVAIYMAMSAVRFMYNATPIFAIFSGWMTYEIIKVVGFDKMLKTYRGLKSEKWYAIKKSVKFRHVITALFIAFLIIWPNFWYGFDAGVPYEKKAELDRQIYNSLPDGLKPDKAQYDQGGQWWLGAFGTAYPSDYWVDGMFWLADQDTDMLPEDRPAFMSWWDYGHWAVHMGVHPTAADNFQNGFQWAGNYISAQNESVAVALVASKIIEGTMIHDSSVLDILERHVGEEKRKAFIDYYTNPTDYKKEVLDNPHIYGPHDADRIDRNNIKYLMMSRMLIGSLDLESLVDLLHELEVTTGHTMRYFAVDTRLLPVGPRNTGIFYAPIKLSDQNIDDFLVVFAIGNDGSRTNVNDKAAMSEKYKNKDFKIDNYEIEYNDMFYDSMFYRAYIGWKPIDAEINEPGIPAVSRAADVGRDKLQLSSMPPIQGWGMTHHRLAYRTQYWNSNKTDPSKHPKDWKVISQKEAAKYKNMSENEDPTIADRSGVIDTTYRGLFGGVFFLKYYDGAFINGTVRMEDGTPLSDVRVTVYDDVQLVKPNWPGAPHGYTYTNQDGRYSIIAPYGNVTVRYSNGGQTQEGNDRTEQLLMQSDKRILNETVIHVSDNQAMRINEDLDHDGIWDYNIWNPVVINFSHVKGNAYWDMNNDSKFDDTVDVPLSGRVSLTNSSFDWNRSVDIAENGSFHFDAVLPDDYFLNYEPSPGQIFHFKEISVDAEGTFENDIGVTPSRLNGTVVDKANNTLSGVELSLTGRFNTTNYRTSTDENGTFDLDAILPGNYTLSVDDVRYSTLDILIDIDNGVNITQNISVSGTVMIDGTASLPDGSPGTDTTIIFRNVADDSLSQNIKVGAKGKFEGHLPPGNYSVNGKVIKGDSTFVFIETIEINVDMVLNMPFKRAFKINGTVYTDLNKNDKYDPFKVGSLTPNTQPPSIDDGIHGGINLKESKSDMFMDIQGASGNITLMDNKDGYYEVYLPPGHYSVFSYSTTASGGNLSGISALDVSEDKEFNIQVKKGTNFEGIVFNDNNDDNMFDQTEILEGAKISIEDGSKTIERYSNSTGSFKMLLSQGPYNVTVDLKGYDTYSDNITMTDEGLSKNIILEPRNISVKGLVGHDANGNGIIDAGEGVQVIVKFITQVPNSEGVEIETDTNGTYSVNLFPQNYTVRVDQTKTEYDGSVKYLFEDKISLSIGDEETPFDIGLNKSYKVEGDIYYDMNDDGILNSNERRSPKLEFVAPSGDTYDAKVEAKGFNVWLPKGQYFYYSHEPDPDAPTGHIAALGKISVTTETITTVKLVPATRANGVLFFDENGNGELDTGEQERDVDIRISKMDSGEEVGRTTVRSNDIGEYSIYIPQDANYTFSIDEVYERELLNNNYTVKYTYDSQVNAADSSDILLLDLMVDMFYKVSGSVIYEGPEGPETLTDATVVFDEFTSSSDEDGNFDMFVRPGKYNADVLLPGFVLPQSAFGERVVDFDKTTQTFILDPVNVTLEGHVFVDHNKDGLMDPDLEGVKVNVDFIAADDRTVNATASSDPKGLFKVDLEPGNYYVYAATTEGPSNYVFFDHFGIDASGEVQVTKFELKDAIILQGDIYLNDTDGNRVIPKTANITIRNNSTGVERTVLVRSKEFMYSLPAGEYNLSGHFVNKEYGRDMDYHLETNINLTERTKMDLVFEKLELYYLDIVWDEEERVLLPQNGTITYNFTVKNVGNSPGYFELNANAPTGWDTEIDVKDKVFLNIDQTRSYTVRINISQDAKAGENTINLVGRSMANDDFVNSTRAYVDVIQVFGIKFESSDKDPTYEGGTYYYTVNLVNDGNGNDQVSVSLRAPFPGWNITIEDPEPILSNGQQKEIRVLLIPNDPANMIGRNMKLKLDAISQSSETAEYELPVTFPDLKGNFHVSGPGVKDNKAPSGSVFIPSFDILVVIVALAVVAMVIRRKGGARE